MYWLDGAGTTCGQHEESDIALLEQRYITAVPLHVNELTDQHHFSRAKFAQEPLDPSSPLVNDFILGKLNAHFVFIWSSLADQLRYLESLDAPDEAK
ncbi:MAG: hypothetical protein AAF443_04670 [Chlamydiota bacterium]